MEEVTNELLKHMKKRFSETGTVDENLLTALHFLYPTCMLNVLDLVDRKKIVKYISKSGRCLFEVVGSSGTPYLCLLDGNFCECPAFKFAAMKNGGHTTCKHLLAIKVALAISPENVEKTRDTDYGIRIIEIDDNKMKNLFTNIN